MRAFLVGELVVGHGAVQITVARKFVAGGDASEVIASEYNVIDPPTIIVIDSRGNIVDRFLSTTTGVSADLSRLS